MLKTISILLICLVPASDVLAVADSPAESGNSELAIDYSSRGIHWQFPYFMPQLRSIDPQLKQVLIENMEETLNILKEALSNSLDGKGGWLMWGKTSARMLKMGRDQANRRAALKIKVGTNGSFNKHMPVMFKDLVAQSKIVEEKLKGTQPDPQALKHLINTSIDSLLEAFKSSPTAIYVDWRRATANGQPFDEFAGNIMGQLRYNGFGAIIGVLDKLMTFVR